MPGSSGNAFVDRLRGRAVRAFARPDDIAGAFSAFRGVVGPRVDELAPAARRAHDLLRDRHLPSADDIAALEYAIRLLRPAPLVCQGVVEPNPSFPLWDAFRSAAGALTPAVARVDRLESDGLGNARPIPIGSGFLVRRGLLLTNRHVLSQLTNGSEVLGPGMAQARFRHEYGERMSQPPVPVSGVAAVHRELDLALLALDAASELAAPLAFSTEPARDGEAVVAVGYPGQDADNPVFVSPLFGGKFGVLRAAPGEVLEAAASGFDHDCTTLRGSSGSPVIGMATGRVVGVHASGSYLYRNAAVAAACAARMVEEASA